MKIIYKIGVQMPKSGKVREFIFVKENTQQNLLKLLNIHI